MKKYLYFYQLEKYETLRFLKKVYRSILNRFEVEELEIKWNLKSRFLYYYSIVIFIILSALLMILLPYYFFIPGIISIWLLKFLILIFAEKMYSFYEKRANKKQYEEAKQKIEAFNEVVFVGIAGSSGKSSVRHILTELLGANAVATTDDEEDPSEIVESINKKLTLGVEYFVVEMNADKKNRVKRMCQLINPYLGILTNINEQKLSRYKKIENTIDSKFELLNNLSADGVGIVNLDNKLVYNNLDKSTAPKLIGYSLSEKRGSQYKKEVIVKNYLTTKTGSEILIEIYSHDYLFETSLVGKTHLSNLVAAITCAVKLGLKPDLLVKRIKNMPQIPGRMEIKKRDGINVIDNSAGSNVAGFRNSLSILEKFEAKKALITPGIYEAGDKSKNIHKMLGYMSAEIVDLVILMGASSRTKNIREGLLDNGFDKNKIIRVKNLNEAYKFIEKNLNEGDAVLIENSLDLRFL